MLIYNIRKDKECYCSNSFFISIEKYHKKTKAKMALLVTVFGATTFTITTINIMTINIMTLSIMTLIVTIKSNGTFSIMTQNIIGLDRECCYTECRNEAFKLNVVMLSVVMSNAIMLNVVAPSAVVGFESSDL
jgi:hypothetical protein